MEIVTSFQNAGVKKVKALAEKKYRLEYGEYVVEGEHMVREALLALQDIEKIFVSETAIDRFSQIIKLAEEKVTIVSSDVFTCMSLTESPQGILAVLKMRPSEIWSPSGKPFLVLDRLQDPGNLGTIIRTAAATGFKDILLIHSADPYNPKTVRSSSSGIFFVNFYPLTEDELLDAVDKNNIELITADATGENIFETKIENENIGLVIGNEANGPSETIFAKSAKIVAIPMKSMVESLNAGVSASILMYMIVGKNI